MQIDFPALHDLLKRIEDATGPDRALDQLLSLALLWPDHTDLTNPDWVFLQTRNAEGSFDGHAVEWHTASIDAALALMARVCGDVSWRVGNTPSGRGFCYLGTGTNDNEAASPALAIIAGAVRWKLSRETL